MVYTEWKKSVRGKGDPPLSHQVWSGPPGLLNSFSERSLGAAGSRTGLRPPRFMTTGYA